MNFYTFFENISTLQKYIYHNFRHKQSNHRTNHLIETEIAGGMTSFIIMLVILTNFTYPPIGHLDQLYKYNKMKEF